MGKANQSVPACRDGHTSVVHDFNMYVFGGMEDGKRTNSLLKLDIAEKIWTNVNTKGNHTITSLFESNTLIISFQAKFQAQDVFTPHA